MALWRILWTLVHRGAPPISRYTRVLRAAHGRVKSTLHSRFGSLIVHELWLTIHLLFPLVLCWFGSNLYLLNTQQASVSLRHWHTERLFLRAIWLPKLSIVFALRSLYHQMALILSSINCCSSVHACHTETTTVVGSSYIWQQQTYGKLLAANLVNPVRRHRPEGSGPMLARWGQHRAGTGPADTTTREDSSLPPMTEPARSS